MAPASSEQLAVPFQGEGSGTAELTWGQYNIWQAMEAQGSSLPLRAVRDLPAGQTVDDIVAELQFYLHHYESMRTRLEFAPDGSPRQVVSTRGELPLRLLDADGRDPAEVAADLSAQFGETPFDYPREWPVRAGVVRRHGVPTHLVMAVSHLAIDASGAAVMVGSRDPATGRLRAPLTAPQPRELAAAEAGPAAERLHQAALRRWGTLLRTIPPDRFGAPPGRPAQRYQVYTYDSPAMLAAQRVVAARTGAPPSPVLLATFAVALAGVTGIHPVVTQILVSNRFRPGLAEVVAPVVQPGLCVLDIAGSTFDEVVATAARRSLAASKHAYYDLVRLNELVARVARERGQDIDLACIYNDRRQPDASADSGPPPTAAQVRALLPQARLRREPLPHRFHSRLNLGVEDTPQAVRLKAQADTRFLAAADLEALLRGMEAALVRAVTDPAAPAVGAAADAVPV